MLQTPLDTNRSVTDLAIPDASLPPADRATPLKTSKHEIPLVFRSFPALSLIRGPRGHAGDV